MEEKKRARVIIKGKVQGVFFRMETKRAAQRIGVTGWVKNKRDGSVEAVFEGDGALVDSIIKWCDVGSPGSKVEEKDVNWEDYQGEFGGFTIVFD